jgi:hypothetical protein
MIYADGRFIGLNTMPDADMGHLYGRWSTVLDVRDRVVVNNKPLAFTSDIDKMEKSIQRLYTSTRQRIAALGVAVVANHI